MDETNASDKKTTCSWQKSNPLPKTTIRKLSANATKIKKLMDIWMLNTASGSFNTIYKRHAQFDKLTQVVKSNTQLHVDI